ncbi:hypothetical protein GDO86_006150 [Hymenochirus boettgeri]|uniref:Podocin n=1 Tax=Hymenochirus boettgeri TaxID=247094 RepID=A0A8T2JAE4_9PIPI|nr:hypothetical protein GDO86_006150 [Hymenochirus boettgeri]
MWDQYKYTALPVPHISHNPSSVPPDTWLLYFCHKVISCLSFLLLLVTFPISAWCYLKVVPDYQRIVIFRIGRMCPPRGPGLVVLLPIIDQFHRVDMRPKAFSVPPSKVKSRDGVLISMGADIQFRICDPVLSVLSVQDLNFVTRHTAQNLMIQTLGRKYVREIHNDRARIADYLKEDINEQVKPWGVSVERVDLALESILETPESVMIVPPVPQAASLSSGMDQLLMQFLSLIRHDSKSDTPLPTGTSLKQLFLELEASMSESLVSEVRSSYQFYVIMPGGERAAYFIDLTSGSGYCGWGELPSPDVTLETTETDLISLISGNLNPLTAYTGGRLRVIGDIQTAMQLERVLQVAQQQK